jgi:Tol biopolymer transport system component
MAHYSYASPDHKTALVVEMNEHVKWAMCRLISLDDHSGSKPIGPPGACTAAGWSPDGSWMYFIATVEGRSHLWRQRYPNGQPEQLTFGPTEEEGLAVAHDGRSLITSMGAKGSAIWIHDTGGERALSSEGETLPHFGPRGEILFQMTVGASNYVEQMNQDGSHRSRAIPLPHS